MGCAVSLCAGARDEVRMPVVLLLGLDGTGTTTILNRLKGDERAETTPTAGVNKENVAVSGMELEVYDVGGLEQVRSTWRQYSKEANAVVYVVDASDPARLPLAATELKKLFFGDRKKKSLIVPDIPLLLLANKMDVEGALELADVESALDLQDLPVRRYRLLGTVAVNGKNVERGFSWLVSQLREYGH